MRQQNTSRKCGNISALKRLLTMASSRLIEQKLYAKCVRVIFPTLRALPLINKECECLLQVVITSSHSLSIFQLLTTLHVLSDFSIDLLMGSMPFQGLNIPKGKNPDLI